VGDQNASRPCAGGCERPETPCKNSDTERLFRRIWIFSLPVEAALPKSVIRRFLAPKGVSVGLLFGGALGSNPPSEAQALGPSFLAAAQSSDTQEPTEGVALNGAYLWMTLTISSWGIISHSR
jgi:hypothetical protein